MSFTTGSMRSHGKNTCISGIPLLPGKERVGIEQAVSNTIASVTKDWIIYDAVQAAGKELNNMILSEFNEERYRQDLIAQGEELGEKKGLALGLELGKELGRKESDTKTAVRMIHYGESDTYVCKTIGTVSMTEIADLRKDLTENPGKYSHYLAD